MGKERTDPGEVVVGKASHRMGAIETAGGGGV